MEAMIERDVLADIRDHYLALSALVPLQEIKSAEEYAKAVAVLDRLLDAGAASEAHPLSGLVEILGQLIEDYDAVHYSMEVASPAAVLRLLMDQRSLTEMDLPELGSEKTVLEILSGNRKLNVHQIQLLSARFNVPRRVFAS
jgi:HTH-type transcriptional regulator/antitoxin HigA